jgi:hypothetical protein
MIVNYATPHINLQGVSHMLMISHGCGCTVTMDLLLANQMMHYAYSRMLAIILTVKVTVLTTAESTSRTCKVFIKRSEHTCLRKLHELMNTLHQISSPYLSLHMSSHLRTGCIIFYYSVYSAATANSISVSPIYLLLASLKEHQIYIYVKFHNSGAKLYPFRADTTLPQLRQTTLSRTTLRKYIFLFFLKYTSFTT